MEHPRAKLAYLGPLGTFTQQAAKLLDTTQQMQHVPVASVPEVCDAVRTGDADTGVVPLENSIEGSVGATLDELAHGAPLSIVREIVFPVRFGVYTRVRYTLQQRDEISSIASHPHAVAQCRAWVQKNLSTASVHRSASTADAAVAVARGEYDAAICAHVAAEEYDLHQFAEDVGDHPDAVTRFVEIMRSHTLPAPSGDDITSVALTLPHDEAGSLQAALQHFSDNGVNLTRIESRPTKQMLGEYVFFLDCEGHRDDPAVAAALASVVETSPWVRFLGSYPRWRTTT